MAICHADTVLNVLETGKPYPLKFAWIHSTNLYACGTSVPQRWFEAMKKLDFIVASDLFMTPTIMGLADVFVPVATFPEHDGIVQPHFGRCTHFLGAMNKACLLYTSLPGGVAARAMGHHDAFGTPVLFDVAVLLLYDVVGFVPGYFRCV